MEITAKLMRNIFRIIFFMSISMYLTACDVGKDNTDKDKKGLGADFTEELQPLIGSEIRSASVSDIDGKMAVLFPRKDTLVFKSNNKETIVSNNQVPETGIWLHQNSKWVYALWWNKTPEGKKLRIKSSPDRGKTFSEEASFIAQKGIVPFLSITDDGSDKIAVAYISERFKGYQVYFNRSIDGGKTWYESDLRMNTLYDLKGPVELDAPLADVPAGSHASEPYIQYIGDKLVLLWQEIAYFDSKKFLRVVAKTSLDDGQTWSDESEIVRLPDLDSQEMHVNTLNGELFVALFVPKKGVMTFVSKNQVNNWDNFTTIVGSSEDTLFSYFKSTSLSNGSIFLSCSSHEGDNKTIINMYKTKLGQTDWKDISDLINVKQSNKQAGDNDFRTKATLPAVASFSDNVVFIAWEDYEGILPAIKLNYSLDAGENWQKKASVFAPPGKIATQFPSFIEGKNTLSLSFTYHDVFDSSQQKASFYKELVDFDEKNLIKINLPKQDIMYKAISDKEKMKKLKERSDSFWALRVKQDYAGTYSYFDPLYRMMFPLQTFLQTQGKITFLEAKTGEINIKGNLASVDTDITISLTVFENMGLGMEASTPQKKEMQARWGWFYDNWYLMPETLFDRRFKY